MDLICSLRNAILTLRAADTTAAQLAERGKFSVYHSICGKEATLCGAAFGLGAGDWLFLGPQVPEGGFLPIPTPHSLVVPTSPSPTAARLVHATGVGMAIAAKKHDRVVCVVFGDGLADSADFHVAVNFASVYNAPVLFLATVTLAMDQPIPEHLNKTLEAYGVPGAEVDGTDAVAVQNLVATMAQEIREHHGARLIVARINPEAAPDRPLEALYRLLQQDSGWNAQHDDAVAAEAVALGWEWAHRFLLPSATEPGSHPAIALHARTPSFGSELGKKSWGSTATADFGANRS